MSRAVLWVVLITCVAASGAFAGAAENKYVGVKLCAACHKTEKQGKQFDIWKASKHAGAFQTLLSAKANEVAKARGLSKLASESPECLECHVVTESTLIEKSFDMKDGVQCEACHGAGSAYKSITVMKDKAKAIAAGMKEYKDEAAIEKQCKTCHNDRSPSYKEFKFKEMWDKIKHPVPKK